MRLSSLSLSLTAFYGSGFSWRSLFADGTPGFRINIEEALRINAAAGGDPSKCVAFQDSAGTLPVTAMEQPLGYIKDLSGNDNHFIQPGNTASRPIVSRRVNLLESTEDFSNDLYWEKVRSVVSDKTHVSATETNSNGFYVRRGPLSIPAAASLRMLVRLERGSQDWALVTVSDGAANGVRQWVNTATGQLGTALPFGSGWSRGAASAELDGGDVVLTMEVDTAGSSAYLSIYPATSGDGLHPCVFGDYGFIKQADLRLSIDASLPPYQRVTSPTDYDEVGFPAYARFDGLDDWLKSDVVDMTSTDEVTVLVGVAKLSDVAGIVIESSVNSGSNNGSILLVGPSASGQLTWRYRSRGTSTSEGLIQPFLVVDKAVITGLSKISTDFLQGRRNGVIDFTVPTDQGTGNYGAHEFYMGRRGGSSIPFNGRIYGVTVIGKLLTDSQLAAAEYAERQIGGLY